MEQTAGLWGTTHSPAVVRQPGGVMDVRAAQARRLHREARERWRDAVALREQRDVLIRALRSEGWTYKQLAQAVGCSPELAAKVVRQGNSKPHESTTPLA